MNLSQVVESLLFASHEPLSTKAIVKAIKDGLKEALEDEKKTIGKPTESEVTAAIEELNKGYARRKHAFLLVEGPSGWKVYTRPEFAGWVRQLFPGKKSGRLSPPALETLAIIAYRQPITKADIEAVRGVSVDGVLQTVMDRGLVHIAGRAEVPGRPLLYETTQGFLEHFGIKNVEHLPNAAELRRVELPTAETEKESGEGENGEAPIEEQLALAAAGDEGATPEEKNPAGDEAGEPAGDGGEGSSESGAEDAAVAVKENVES